MLKTAFESVFPDLTEYNVAELDLLSQDKNLWSLEKDGKRFNLKTFSKYNLKDFVTLRDKVTNPSSQDDWKIRLTHQFVYGELSRFEPVIIPNDNVKNWNWSTLLPYWGFLLAVSVLFSFISPLLGVMAMIATFMAHSSICSGLLVFGGLDKNAYMVFNDVEKGVFPYVRLPFSTFITENFFTDKEVAKRVLEEKRFELLPVKNDEATKILLEFSQADLAEYEDSLYLLSEDEQNRIREKETMLYRQKEQLEQLKTVVPDLAALCNS